MAFIVKKRIHGKDYYYLQKSKRIGGKVKSICLGYLGKTRKDAEKNMKNILEKEDKKDSPKKEIVDSFQLEKKKISIEELAIFCKRKGFVYLSGEIYGGLSGFWDFGHLGTGLKNNLKDEWWKFHVVQRGDMVGIDGSIITSPEVWKASGHTDNFNDVLVICKKCKKPAKIDRHELGKVKCECGGDYDEKTAKNIQLMFETNVGDKGKAFLRPETAQLIFTNFKSVYDNTRMKLPFGIAQIGKVFRNEIAPRDFLFRSREFEQMELEYFTSENQPCPYPIPSVEILIYSAEAQNKEEEPIKMKIKDALKKGIIKKDWHAYWLATEFIWFKSLGANPENFRLRQHKKDELAHYSTDCWDLEYHFPFGWKELEGIADRGTFDLNQHEKFSKKDLRIFDEGSKQKIIPQVICEPSLGVDRAFLVFMFDSFFYDKSKENIVLKIHPKLAPVKAAVFPIVKRKDFEKISEEIVEELRQEWNINYDQSGSIGRRYARNDEIGTPFCITIDEKTLQKHDVTVRWRDTGEQVRIKIKALKESLRKAINGEEHILKLGKIVNTRKK